MRALLAVTTCLPRRSAASTSSPAGSVPPMSSMTMSAGRARAWKGSAVSRSAGTSMWRSGRRTATAGISKRSGRASRRSQTPAPTTPRPRRQMRRGLRAGAGAASWAGRHPRSAGRAADGDGGDFEEVRAGEQTFVDASADDAAAEEADAEGVAGGGWRGELVGAASDERCAGGGEGCDFDFELRLAGPVEGFGLDEA